mmetsp:Transcript_11391/g.20545  ORF Transcript_11391/g.20545 Transcript_11391/m.20545 type:complete len:391 (-) Transcript_11391:680-1852(-)
MGILGDPTLYNYMRVSLLGGFGAASVHILTNFSYGTMSCLRVQSSNATASNSPHKIADKQDTDDTHYIGVQTLQVFAVGCTTSALFAPLMVQSEAFLPIMKKVVMTEAMMGPLLLVFIPSCQKFVKKNVSILAGCTAVVSIGSVSLICTLGGQPLVGISAAASGPIAKFPFTYGMTCSAVLFWVTFNQIHNYFQTKDVPHSLLFTAYSFGLVSCMCQFILGFLPLWDIGNAGHVLTPHFDKVGENSNIHIWAARMFGGTANVYQAFFTYFAWEHLNDGTNDVRAACLIATTAFGLMFLGTNEFSFSHYVLELGSILTMLLWTSTFNQHLENVGLPQHSGQKERLPGVINMPHEQEMLETMDEEDMEGGESKSHTMEQPTIPHITNVNELD